MILVFSIRWFECAIAFNYKALNVWSRLRCLSTGHACLKNGVRFSV